MKWKPLPGQVRQSAKNSLNQNLVIKSFWENCFEATLRTKADVLNVWKANFSVFYKFMSNKLETIFRESDAKRSKIFKVKFDHRKVLRKLFWSLLEVKNEYFERLSFLQIFEWQNWNHISGKWRKTLKTI